MGDFIRVNSVSTGQQKDYTPFKVTPPAAGGSGTITWEFWKVSGWPTTSFDVKLTNYNQSVSALGVPGAFSLSSPAANATGVDPKPVLSWGSASAATSYRVEMTGDLAGGPNPVHFKDQNVGNVTSWTYDGNPALTWGSVVWWHVIAVNVAGETECTGSWRKFTVRNQIFSGRIDSASPSSFVGNQTSNLTIKATYTGDGTCDLAVKVVSVPSGWSVNNGTTPSDCQRQNGVSSGVQTTFLPFNVTPPAPGGSATFQWELWKVSGVWPANSWDVKLTNYNQNVNATPQMPIISDISDAATPPGKEYTASTPMLSQGTGVGWSLVSGPSGMTINAGTGVVSWPNPLASPTAYTVTIRATNTAGSDDETWLLTVYNSRITSVSPSRFPSRGKATITVTVKNEISTLGGVGTRYRVAAPTLSGWTISPAAQDTSGGMPVTDNIPDNGIGTATFEVTPPVGGASVNWTWGLQWYDGPLPPNNLKGGLANYTQTVTATTNLTKIILDTDLATDCDDLGVVAMLHAYANQGKAEVLGMVCNVSDEYSPLCLDAINSYYGHPNIPIGEVMGSYIDPTSYVRLNTPNYPNRYTECIATNFTRTLQLNSVPDAVEIYRQTLQSNTDVTIVSVGSFYNLKRLLVEHFDLVRDKVAKLVVMGGSYPNSIIPSLPDYNFSLASEATQYVVDNWPTPIVFTSLGSDVITGTNLFDNSAVSTNNPIRAGYDLGTKEWRVDDPDHELVPPYKPHRPSWDQIAVLYAIEGTSIFFAESESGTNHISILTDAWNQWSSCEGGNHRYLKQVTPTELLKSTIESLMTAKVRTVIQFPPISPNPLSLGSPNVDLTSMVIVNAGRLNEIQFTSSNPNVVSIVNGHELHAVAPGTATITALCGSSTCFDAATNVSQPIQVVDLSWGSVKVDLVPAEAASAGARWQIDGGAWKTNDATVTGLTVGSHTLSFKAVSGFVSPSNQFVTINNGTTTTATGTYTLQPRIIGVSGDLAFGNVAVGQTLQRTMTVTNSGSGDLHVTTINYPDGFSGNWSWGTIPPGGAQNVIVSFAPALVTTYGGTVTVTSDSTSGNGTIAAFGTGIVSTEFEAWQLLHFGCTNCPEASATADPDGDNQNNLAEFRAGTDPRYSASTFRITVLEKIGADIRATFTSVSGKYYALDRCDFIGGTWTTIANNIPGNDGIQQATDIGGANRGSAFYRVRLNEFPNPVLADSDGDGIPDFWMMQYFNHSTGQVADKSRAGDDADGDGMSNSQEFLTGTNPTNSASAFRILSIIRENNDLRVAWLAADGHTNVVQAAPDISGSFSDVSSNIVITGTSDTTTNYLDLGAVTNSPGRFYRIRLVP